MKNAEMAYITRIRTRRDMRRPYRQAASRWFCPAPSKRDGVAAAVTVTRYSAAMRGMG
jgi:hypothetical protein